MKASNLALALFAVCAFAAAHAQAVIDFPHRAGTAMREGSISRSVTGWDYQVRARPGQTLTIKLESPTRGAVFVLSYEGEGDHLVILSNNARGWSGRLPATGVEDKLGYATYNLSVSSRARRPRGEVRFRLTVSLR